MSRGHRSGMVVDLAPGTPGVKLSAQPQKRTTKDDILDSVDTLEQAVSKRDSRGFYRLFGTLVRLRRGLDSGQALLQAAETAFPADSDLVALVRRSVKTTEFAALNFSQKEDASAGGGFSDKGASAFGGGAADAMDVDAEEDQDKEKEKEKEKDGAPKEKVFVMRQTWEPEVELFFRLLCIMILLDNACLEEALECSEDTVQFCQQNDRHTLDALAGKAYFFYARCHELNDTLESIRGTLHAALRTATLRHDEYRQAVLTNLLLRNYIKFNLYEQAMKFVKNSQIDQVSESHLPNEFARYYYYLGRIQAIHLNYADAYVNLMSASRKAPTVCARGFRSQVQNLAVLVQLLMGEIPERNVFRDKTISWKMRPYLELTRAVRIGEMGKFKRVVEEYEEAFVRDHNMTLIQRLRTNVLKTGLKKLNLAYSCISLEDVAEKLLLDSAEVAEGVVAKAIRDGVIDAVIDHEGGCIRSRENVDVYFSNEPHLAFRKRINFCMELHNEAVRAMRFPPDAHMEQLAKVEEEKRLREKEERELLESGELDEDDSDSDDVL